MKSFSELQKEMASCSKKGIVPTTNIENLETYRRMVYDNTANALATTYEMTKLAMGENRWKELVDGFVKDYHSDEPRYWKMPKRLLDYEKNQNWGLTNNMPWLNESLQFEWTLTEIFHLPDEKDATKAGFSSLEDQPVLTSSWQLMIFNYPVYKPEWNALNHAAGTYHILVYRNPATLQVKIEELNHFLHSFLAFLSKKRNQSILAVFESLLEDNRLKSNPEMLKSAEEFCWKLKSYGVLA
jgi:hypothetical protein